MRILFDLFHPAHFHLFKNCIKNYLSQGDKVIITARAKDVLIDLLEHENFTYTILTRSGANLYGKLFEASMRGFKLLLLCKKFNPDLLIGSSVNIPHVGKLIRKPSVLFCEDDENILTVLTKLYYPFASYICIPDVLTDKLTKRHITYNGYHELAYLHPNNFKADITILEKYKLEPYKYIIIRRSALKATHDVGAKGLSGKIWGNLMGILKHFSIVNSTENDTHYQINPWDMHPVLSFAKMLITDSQTMTMEAAVLGVPSIRYSSFVGKISVLEELENKYNLTYGYKPGSEIEMLKKIHELSKNEMLNDQWKEKRYLMLKNKLDLNQWMIELFDSLI